MTVLTLLPLVHSPGVTPGHQVTPERAWRAWKAARLNDRRSMGLYL